MTRPVTVCAGGVLMLTLWASLAFGQAAQTPNEPPPRREGGGELSLVNTTGNTDASAFGAGADFTLRPGKWVYEEKLQYIRTEDSGIVDAESLAERFRAGRVLNPHLNVFAEYGYLRDVFSGIDHRNTISGGLSFVVIDSKRQTFNIDGSLGYAKEQRPIDPTISTGIVTGGTKYRLRLTETAEFADDFALMESFYDSSDWRINHFIGVTAKISTIFALKVGNTLRYVNAPPTTREKNDSITSATIVARFRSQ